MTAKQYIKDLKEKDAVDSLFLAAEKHLLKDRNGKTFLSMTLSDISGGLNGRIWDKVDEVQGRFEAGDIVKVKGHVQVYQGKRQLVVHELFKVDPKNCDLRDFMNSSSRPSEEMYAELLGYVKTMRDPQLKELVESALLDPEIKPRLMMAPAAKSVHHAYLGGLLDHVLSITKILDFLSQHYPQVDRDYLVFGAIFHDIGKIWELDWEGGIHYTDRGRLVGHMQMACELVDKCARQIEGFSQEKTDLLKHIILSHHGRLEYGSPKRPKFLEAQLVAQIDELDSRFNSLLGVMKGDLEGGGNWSQYSTAFERYLYLGLLRDKEK